MKLVGIFLSVFASTALSAFFLVSGVIIVWKLCHSVTMQGWSTTTRDDASVHLVVTGLNPSQCTSGPIQLNDVGSEWACGSIEVDPNEDDVETLAIDVQPGAVGNAFRDSVLEVVIWNIDAEYDAGFVINAGSDAVQIAPPQNRSVDDTDLIHFPGTWTANNGNGDNYLQFFNGLISTALGQDDGSVDTGRYTSHFVSSDAVQDVLYAFTASYGHPCVGEWRVRIDEDLLSTTGNLATLKFGVAARVVDSPRHGMVGAQIHELPSISTESNSSTMPDVVLPSRSTARTKVHAEVDEQFARELYIVKNLTVSVTTGLNRLVLEPDNEANLGSSWTISLDHFTSEDGDDDIIDFREDENKVIRSWEVLNYDGDTSPDPISLVVDLPSLTAADPYENADSELDWSSSGPFLMITLHVDHVEEYPTIYSPSQGGVWQEGDLDNRAWTAAEDQHEIYQVVLDPMWWNLTLEFDTVEAQGREEYGVATSIFAFEVEEQKAGRGQAQQAFQAGGWGGFDDVRSNSFYNSDFYTWSTSRRDSKANEQLTIAPLRRLVPIRYFVRVSSRRCGTDYVSFRVRGVAENVPGECRSYADCATEKDHPSEGREDNSANGDARRFAHCGVFNRGSVGDLTPETRCFECNGNEDCDEGQYCQDSDGIAAAEDGTDYKVSGFLDRTYRLCQEKSSDVLGKRCRVDTNPGQFNSGNDRFNTDVVRGSNDGYADGYGFCGEALYFNSTAVANMKGLADGFDYDHNGGVAVVLWRGECLNNECFECNPDDTDHDTAGKECINGRVRNARHVDFTIRTFGQNTQAGLLLALVIFLIVFQCCFAAQMNADANRHREHFKTGPMSTMDILKAVFCCLPCCKSTPSYVDGGKSCV